MESCVNILFTYTYIIFEFSKIGVMNSCLIKYLKQTEVSILYAVQSTIADIKALKNNVRKSSVNNS